MVNININKLEKYYKKDCESCGSCGETQYVVEIGYITIRICETCYLLLKNKLSTDPTN